MLYINEMGNMVIRCFNCKRIYYFADRDIFEMMGIKLKLYNQYPLTNFTIRKNKEFIGEQSIKPSEKIKTYEEIKEDVEWKEFVEMASRDF